MAKTAVPRGFARGRVLEAALALFAEHGVHGTSLRMIADRVGVGKAAVYYQFNSKHDIVLEAIRPTIEDMARVIRTAGALPDPARRRVVAVSGMVEIVVRNRQLAIIFHGDPAINKIMNDEPDFKAVADGLRDIVQGPERNAAERINCSVILCGMGRAAADPNLVDIDDDELHRALLAMSIRLLTPTTEDPCNVTGAFTVGPALA